MRSMKMAAILVVMLPLLLSGCTGTAEGDSPPAEQGGEAPSAIPEVTVPAGTQVSVALDTALDSSVSRVGDVFTASVTSDVIVQGRAVIPVGSQVSGSVTAVKPAKRGAGRAQMTLEFSGVKLPGGEFRPLTASLAQETEGKKKRNAAIIGGSAAGGAVVGRVLGDDAKDAAVGAIVGGAIGTGVVLAQEGEQVSLPAGTVLVLDLEEPLEVPAEA